MILQNPLHFNKNNKLVVCLMTGIELMMEIIYTKESIWKMDRSMEGGFV